MRCNKDNEQRVIHRETCKCKGGDERYMSTKNEE